MKIVVTGANGFIGSNLRVRLREAGHDVVGITRADADERLRGALADAEFVFHLAGVNRPKNQDEFAEGNARLTATLCEALARTGRAVPLLFSSSIQADGPTPYGASKRDAEDAVERYHRSTGADTFVMRLPNVFGKWCRPNYNSVVATFCDCLARGAPLTIDDPAASLSLVYVDDVVTTMLTALTKGDSPWSGEVNPIYATTVGELAGMLRAIDESRRSLRIPRVGSGLQRALYATYVSYLRPQQFAYDLAKHDDARGTFVEMLKTADSGQFSYFSSPPGATRGEHYHHTKTEKFLVLSGKARFAFRHIVSGEQHEIVVDGAQARVVESIPGWAHNVTNIGPTEMLVMLWANEVFDPEKPDTVGEKVTQ